MLRIVQSANSAQAKHYYTSADYYSEGQELEGRWRGKAAAELGLQGTIMKHDWNALCDNRNPASNAPLTLRTKSDRTVGYDFTFGAPKSLSLLYTMTRDERLLEAFQSAVDDTMHDVESEMATRVRKGGKDENRITGNMVWGEYIHLTSRPIDGLPDPHLHSHCFVFNATWDKDEQSFKAGQFRELKRDAPYFEALFHSRLANNLQHLGLPIERTAKGWELAGIDSATLRDFSRRTQEIEAIAREKGIVDAHEKDGLGAKTRSHKIRDLSMPELQSLWHERMSPVGQAAIAALQQRIGGESEPADHDSANKSMEHAVSHVFERQSVVPERTVLTAALKHAVGKATHEQVLHHAKSVPFVRGLRNGRAMVTTREVLLEERYIIDFARRGRGTSKPIASKNRIAVADWLSAEQQSALNHILTSTDRVMVVRGAAGVGKTTLMKEAAKAIHASDKRIVAVAPTAGASRGVQRGAGFTDADTIATFLKNEELQQKAKGQLIWIDEAGLVGTKTMKQVIELAERLDARLLLTGDRKQHGSVERGSVLKLLETEAGIVPAELKDIRRQDGQYKQAVKLFSEGRMGEGFHKLEDLGWVKELPHDKRNNQMAADYVEFIQSNRSALVISPTHAEGNHITHEIRNRLIDKRLLGKSRQFNRLTNSGLTDAQRSDAVNYQEGDVLVFHQNAKGFTRGQKVAVDVPSNVPVQQAARFQTFHQDEISLAEGDRIRITNNGHTADGKHRLNNGTLYTIKKFP